MTRAAYTSDRLAAQAAALELAAFDRALAVRLGMVAADLALSDNLPVTIEVRHLGRVAFRACLPGSLPDSDDWIARKARLVERFESSTLAMRVRYEERGTTFAAATGLPDSEYAAHGGGVPIVVRGVGVVGAIYVSGLPQVDDHEFAVACLTTLSGDAT